METSVKKYYHYNMPRGQAEVEQTVWDSGSQATVTIQPATDKANYVGYIKLLISEDFTMQVGDIITLLITAYGTTQTLEVTTAGVIADDIAQMIGWGDAEMFEDVTLGATHYFKSVIKFKPPVYLRNSTTPAESITLTYNDAGGGPSAGKLIITTEVWVDDEDDSGLE
jgi:hypothetical protein